MKILFCDIDGILTETISGYTFKQSPTDVKIIEGADKAVNYFASRKWKIIGISNQGGCSAINRETGKVLKTIGDAIAEMQFTLQLIPQLDRIYFCSDFDGAAIYQVFPQHYTVSARALYRDRVTDELLYQSFRKPGAGMLQKASHDLEIPLDGAWLVGGRPEDEQSAINAGINFCPAYVWHDRFRPGVFAHNLTPAQLQFLEGVKLGGG